MRWILGILCVAGLAIVAFFFLQSQHQTPRLVQAPPPVEQPAAPPVAPPAPAVVVAPKPTAPVVAPPVEPVVQPIAKPPEPDLNTQLITASAAAKQAQADLQQAKFDALEALKQNSDYQAAVKNANDLEIRFQTGTGDQNLSQELLAAKGKVSTMEADAQKTPAIMTTKDKAATARAALTDLEQKINSDITTELTTAINPMSPGSLDLVKYDAKNAKLTVVFMLPPTQTAMPTLAAVCAKEMSAAMNDLKTSTLPWQIVECAVCAPDRGSRRVGMRALYGRPNITSADFTAVSPDNATDFLDQPVVQLAQGFQMNPDFAGRNVTSAYAAKSHHTVTPARPSGSDPIASIKVAGTVVFSTAGTYTDDGAYTQVRAVKP